MEKEKTAEECLSAALTILSLENKIDAEQVKQATRTSGYNGVFEILNDLYKELKSNS